MEPTLLQQLLLFAVGAGWLLSIPLLSLPWRSVRFHQRLPLRLSGQHLIGLVLVYFLIQGFGQNIVRAIYGGNLFAIDADAVYDWPELVSRIRTEPGGPAARIRELLSDDARDRLDPVAEPAQPDPATVQGLQDELNRILGLPTFYQPASFENVPFQFGELLEEQGATLDPQQLLRLNRILLEASFPELIAPSMQRLFLLLAFVNTLSAIAILAIVRYLFGSPLRHLGLFRPGAAIFSAYGVCQAMFWGPIALACVGILRYLDPPDSLHVAKNFFAMPQSAFNWALLIFNVVVLAPLVEETLFRGLLQGWINQRFHAAVGIVASAVFFGFAHSTWPDPIALTLLGVGLGLTYQLTRSLWSCIAFHAAFNLLGVAMGAAT